MRLARSILTAAAALGTLGTTWAAEGRGLQAEASAWPKWQARLSVATTSPLMRPDAWHTDSAPNSLIFLSNYYFTRSLPKLGNRGGFRATGGILLGIRSIPLLSGNSGGRSLSVDRRSSAPWTLLGDSQDAGVVTYMGIGYTGMFSRSGWGFNAEFGLVGTQTGSPVKLGRSWPGQQNLDDALRDMKMSPLLQFGVSYSF